jgi:hypothetical protein
MYTFPTICTITAIAAAVAEILDLPCPHKTHQSYLCFLDILPTQY